MEETRTMFSLKLHHTLHIPALVIAHTLREPLVEVCGHKVVVGQRLAVHHFWVSPMTMTVLACQRMLCMQYRWTARCCVARLGRVERGMGSERTGQVEEQAMGKIGI